MISSFAFECFKNIGYFDNDSSEITLNTYQDILDKKISFSLDNQGKNKEFIVSGIYDVEKWLDFKIADLFDKDIKQNQKNYFEKLILSSPLTLILVHDNFYEANKNNFIDKNKLYYGSYLKNPLNIGESLESYSYIDLVDKVNVYNILKDTTFENDDLNIAITPEILNNLLDEFLPKIRTNIKTNEILELIPKVLSFNISSSFGWPYTTTGVWMDGDFYGPATTLESNVKKLHEEVYKQTNYEVPEEIKEISKKIIEKTGVQ